MPSSTPSTPCRVPTAPARRRPARLPAASRRPSLTEHAPTASTRGGTALAPWRSGRVPEVCLASPRPLAVSRADRGLDGVLLPQRVGYTGDWPSPSVDRLGCRNVRALLGLLSGKNLRFVESRAQSCLLAGRPVRGYQEGSVSGIDIMYNLSRLLPSLEADEVQQLLEILADVMALRRGEV